MTDQYQMCSRCILDTKDDPKICFDADGVCNHCHGYEKLVSQIPASDTDKLKKLDKVINEVKNSGKGKQYDCILGVSGGVDSTYLAYQIKQWGLRPLVTHFDNGWNSELAVQNIQNILEKLGFDLYTYVVDWNEFRDLQLSYIKASVIDWEIPTDHGFFAMLFHQAKKHGIKYVLSGHNIVTEGILPANMRWSKMDVANLRAIHKKYGTVKLKSFPVLDFFTYIYYLKVKDLQIVSPLNYMDYDKHQAKELITSELGWRDYGGKHYESIFTRFYQGFVLPEKFGVDKRKAHLSTLINSGQITREEALEEMKKPGYDPEQMKVDREFVIKKLGLSNEEFNRYMEQPNRSHLEFESYETGLYRKHEAFFKKIKPLTQIYKKLRSA